MITSHQIHRGAWRCVIDEKGVKVVGFGPTQIRAYQQACEEHQRQVARRAAERERRKRDKRALPYVPTILETAEDLGYIR